MSVYSGFATRLLESQYNGLVCKLIALFEQRITSSFPGSDCAVFFDSEQWGLSFRSVYRAMRKMESQKFLPPKYSHYCRELADQLGSTISRNSSLNSSRLSFNASKDWDTNLHQIEAMFIEESKITRKPPRFAAPTQPARSDPLANQVPAFEPRLQESVHQRSKASYSSSRSKRRSYVSSVSPSRTRPFFGHTINPRSGEISHFSDLADPQPDRHRRRGKREKLSEMYQVRAYSKLLAELGT